MQDSDNWNSLTATVVQVERKTLRGGEMLAIAQLDVSYLQVLQFQAPLNQNRPTAKRKRRQQGLPMSDLVQEIWLISAAGEENQVEATLAMVAPLDAPACISLHSPWTDHVVVGVAIEFRLVRAKAN